MKLNTYGHKGSNQHMNRSNSVASEKGLSQMEQDFLDSHNNEIERNERISDIIESLTNKGSNQYMIRSS